MTSIRSAAAVVLASLALAACAGTPPPGAATARSGPPTSATPPAAVSTTPTSSTTSATGVTPTATAGSSASATPSANSAASSGSARSVSLLFSGDLLWHETTWQSAQADAKRTGHGIDGFDFDPMFAALRPTISSAGLAVCHEEVPFAPKGGPYSGYPTFAAPPEIAPWIASMGWDACTLASNHTLDLGFTGLVRTVTDLRDAGVATAGAFRTATEARTPVILRAANGVRVGLVDGTYGLNGQKPPAGRAWAVSMWNLDNLLGQARAARKAGADIVVVDVHGGTEYQTQPTHDQLWLAQNLTASPDVDAVVGEHVHVVQPITRINGKWVAFGMGNLVAQQSVDRPRTYEGIMVRLTFTALGGGFEATRAEYIPTLITHGDPIRVLPVDASLRAGTGPTERLKQAEAAVRHAVTLLGHTDGLSES